MSESIAECFTKHVAGEGALSYLIVVASVLNCIIVFTNRVHYLPSLCTRQDHDQDMVAIKSSGGCCGSHAGLYVIAELGLDNSEYTNLASSVLVELDGHIIHVRVEVPIFLIAKDRK